MTKAKSQYWLLDIIKFICCLFIVALHSGILKCLNEETAYFIEKLIFRIGVPFFFTTSGFLLGKKVIKTDDKTLIKNIFGGGTLRDY